MVPPARLMTYPDKAFAIQSLVVPLAWGSHACSSSVIFYITFSKIVLVNVWLTFVLINFISLQFLLHVPLVFFICSLLFHIIIIIIYFSCHKLFDRLFEILTLLVICEAFVVYFVCFCVAIFLGSFRMPYQEIRRMIVEVDEEQLTEPMIQVRQVLHQVVKLYNITLTLAGVYLDWSSNSYVHLPVSEM